MLAVMGRDRRRWMRAAVITILAAFASEGSADPNAASPAHRAVILDTTGFWRLHHTLRPPVIQMPDGLKPVLIRKWLDRPAPPPPANWHAVGFDDSTWLRGPARIVCRTPYLARACVRGYFEVTDAAKVADLALSVGYHGGVVVRVNGLEVGRAHLPAGELADDALAEPYPREAFVNSAGGLLIDWDMYKTKLTPERTRRLALRERSIEKLAIPPNVLRKGVNVLTIEIVRAPYDKAVEEKKDAKPGRKGCVYNLAFNTCELMRVQLSAVSGAGLVPQAPRPTGMQVWNSDVLASDFDLDFAGGAEPLYPIRIVGVRNGIFSGKVVVGSDKPIEGLRAAVGPLESAAGAIPASAVRLRYGIPWGSEWGVWGGRYTYWETHQSRYPRQPGLLGALAEKPMEAFPVRKKNPDRASDLNTPHQPDPVFGAVVPVWVTVRVPREAAPGDYRASLTISAKGQPPRAVPVELKVLDWTLPNTQDYRTWTEVIQVPDTSAVEYGAELWSERHWKMIERAMKLIGETSSRVLYMPLICSTNLGNAQSMIRWVAKGDEGFEYDFAVLDRYLDTAVKHMGPPKLIVLQVWDTYLMQQHKLRPSSSHDQEARSLQHLKALKAELGTGPVVTVLDRTTGKAENVTLPHYDDPRGKALWAPLFEKLLNRLAKRGLTKVLALGCMSDAWPNKDESRVFKELSGGLPWISHSHMGVPKWRLHDIADVIYQTTATQNKYANDDPPTGSHYGWKVPELFVEYARGSNYLECPASRLKHTGEFNITGRQRGAGRIGADFWNAVKDKYGRRRGPVAARYPQSSWRNLDLLSSLLGPGLDGPVSTYRFEAFREGLQECEARIMIEQALTDPKLKARLGADMAKRCQEALVERTHYMLKSLGQLRLTGPAHWYVTVDYTYWHRAPGPVGHQWFVGSGWQARSEKLYSLAGEAARKLAGR